MVVPTYEQRLIMKNAEERPTYFMCGKRSLSALMDKARAEDTCDLLFLTLNNLMLNRMLKSGMISFAKGGETA